ncbi:MAG: YigZ family protein [Clostridia bacterium]|nr:YigZ family protein [Clostridia bacterium]
MEQIYLTPQRQASAELIEKRSKFIGNICHVSCEKEALEYIKNLKKKYYDANHNAYAYITENTKRYSDDGEPSKTAGLPILDMLYNKNITDVVCVVTRYFGGTLLGTGGLVRAYTGAAKLALEEAGIKKMLLHDRIIITVPYSLFDNVKYIASECKCDFLNCEYTDIINIDAVSKKADTENLLNQLNATFGINIKIELAGEMFL